MLNLKFLSYRRIPVSPMPDQQSADMSELSNGEISCKGGLFSLLWEDHSRMRDNYYWAAYTLAFAYYLSHNPNANIGSLYHTDIITSITCSEVYKWKPKLQLVTCTLSAAGKQPYIPHPPMAQMGLLVCDRRSWTTCALWVGEHLQQTTAGHWQASSMNSNS